MLGYGGSWKKRVAVIGRECWRTIFQSSKLLLSYEFNSHRPSFYGQTFSFWSKLQGFHTWEVIPFLKTCCKSWRYFAYQSFVQSIFPRHLVVKSGDVVPFKWFSQIYCLAMLKLVNILPGQSVVMKREPVALELLQQTSISTILQFLNEKGRLLKWEVIEAPLTLDLYFLGHYISDMK